MRKWGGGGERERERERKREGEREDRGKGRWYMSCKLGSQDLLPLRL